MSLLEIPPQLVTRDQRMRDLVQEIEEIEELDRLFPPLQVTTRGSAGRTASPQEATNDRVSTLRRELEALTLNENSGAEGNPDTVSPPPYRELAPPIYESDNQEQEPNSAGPSPPESVHHEDSAISRHPACSSSWIDNPRFCGGPGRCDQCAHDHSAYELMHSQLTRVQQEYSGRDPDTLPPKYVPGVCERCTEMKVPGRRACVFHIFENYFRATHRLNVDGTYAPPLPSLCSHCLRLLVAGEVKTCDDCYDRVNFASRIMMEERGGNHGVHRGGRVQHEPEEEIDEAEFVPVRIFL